MTSIIQYCACEQFFFKIIFRNHIIFELLKENPISHNDAGHREARFMADPVQPLGSLPYLYLSPAAVHRTMHLFIHDSYQYHVPATSTPYPFEGFLASSAFQSSTKSLSRKTAAACLLPSAWAYFFSALRRLSTSHEIPSPLKIGW